MENGLIRLLRADEIEYRIATISEKGLSLLFYKDARVENISIRLVYMVYYCFIRGCDVEESRHTEADDLVVTTKSGKANTATNLEHRMETIFKNAGLVDYTGALHIFRRTFATQMYEEGARVKDIAAYIRDLVSTTEQYYIVARKKVKVGDKSKHIVELPKAKG